MKRFLFTILLMGFLTITSSCGQQDIQNKNSYDMQEADGLMEIDIDESSLESGPEDSDTELSNESNSNVSMHTDEFHNEESQNQASESQVESASADITIESCVIPGTYLGDGNTAYVIRSLEDFNSFLLFNDSLEGSTAFIIDLWGDFFDDNVLLVASISDKNAEHSYRLNSIVKEDVVAMKLESVPYEGSNEDSFICHYVYASISKSDISDECTDFSIYIDDKRIDTVDFIKQAESYYGINEYPDDFTDY